jgi:hypothetical protein
MPRQGTVWQVWAGARHAGNVGHSMLYCRMLLCICEMATAVAVCTACEVYASFYYTASHVATAPRPSRRQRC